MKNCNLFADRFRILHDIYRWNNTDDTKIVVRIWHLLVPIALIPTSTPFLSQNNTNQVLNVNKQWDLIQVIVKITSRSCHSWPNRMHACLPWILKSEQHWHCRHWAVVPVQSFKTTYLGWVIENEEKKQSTMQKQTNTYNICQGRRLCLFRNPQH